MKTHQTLVCSLIAAVLATCGFAQGKGGGAPHGGGQPGGAAAGGFGRPSDNPAATHRAAPAESPAKPVPHDAKPTTPADRSAAPAAQDYTARLHEINQTAFNDRKQLLATVDMSLKSSRDALKQIQATAKNARTDARSDFKAALNDVKAREKDVDSALKAVRKADEAGWAARRDALAQAYQNHADALARLDRIARAP